MMMVRLCLNSKVYGNFKRCLFLVHRKKNNLILTIVERIKNVCTDQILSTQPPTPTPLPIIKWSVPHGESVQNILIWGSKSWHGKTFIFVHNSIEIGTCNDEVLPQKYLLGKLSILLKFNHPKVKVQSDYVTKDIILESWLKSVVHCNRSCCKPMCDPGILS